MNESGYRPVEYKVLIKPKLIENKTESGIYLPDEMVEKDRYANTEGTIVAVGGLAFTDPDWTDAPKPGTNVLFDKYAGSFVKGKDGVEYRLINDKNIVAIEV